MNNIAQIINQYTSALKADSYKIQLKNRLTDSGFWVQYSPEQLVKAIGYLRRQNADGFDVYCRPVGYQYVLLDDLTRQSLVAVAEIQPCILMETSPSNYQAWLILADVPSDRESAKSICKELAQRFNADIASAEPDHVGRLPGFTNRKEKHQMANGLFPFVRLRRSRYRLSTFYPYGGAVLSSVQDIKQIPGPAPALTSNNSTSEQDFGKACWLIRQGKPDEYIYSYLLQNSHNLAGRKGTSHVRGYLERTIRKAHQSVKI